MHARRTSFRFKRMAVWQFLFCLTVLSFLCRSAVPAGYMPDLSGSRGDALAIIVCTGGSPAVMQIDFHDRSDDSSDDLRVGQDCPFGLAAAQELLPNGAALVLAGMLHGQPVVLPHAKVGSGTSVLGPPVGSRAPPAQLV